MACLLKVLSDMLQSPQPLSHFHICPKLKVKLGPTDLIYPAPPSSFDTATARNPSQFWLTDRDLGLTEMALPAFCDLLHLFRSHGVMQSVSPSFLDIHYVALLLHSLQKRHICDILGQTKNNYVMLMTLL